MSFHAEECCKKSSLNGILQLTIKGFFPSKVPTCLAMVSGGEGIPFRIYHLMPPHRPIPSPMPTYPSLVLGHEIVGIVTQVGAHVTKFNVGDRVGGARTRFRRPLSFRNRYQHDGYQIAASSTKSRHAWKKARKFHQKKAFGSHPRAFCMTIFIKTLFNIITIHKE